MLKARGFKHRTHEVRAPGSVESFSFIFFFRFDVFKRRARALGGLGFWASTHRIAHSKEVDGRGVEHVRVQFAVRGPQGKGTVHADAYRGESGSWEFAYLLVDVGRERVVVVEPQAAPSIMRTQH